MNLNRLCGLGSLAATVALICLAQPAQAISFLLGDAATNQASMKGIAGFYGEKNQGAYSSYAQTEGFNTVNFNNKTNLFGVVDYQNKAVSDPGIQYSLIGSSAKVITDQWAPSYEATKDNKSSYLTSFSGSKVEVSLDATHNYFGINWGSAHDGNEFLFYNGDILVKRFVYYNNENELGTKDSEVAAKTVNVSSALKTYGVKGNGNEYNAYFNFFADSNDDIFNRIVITQLGGGGFETDNHTFKAGTKGFTESTESVPEPAMALSLLVVGGALVAKRRSGKIQLD